MLRFGTLILLTCLLFETRAQHPPVFEGMRSDTTRIVMNDLTVNLVRYTYRTPKIQFLAIHDDEDTGVKAAFEYIRFSGGSIIDCQYGGSRNFRLSNQGERFQTDPNSIYTKSGIPIGIQKYGPVDDDVVKLMDRAAKTILKLYNPEKLGYILTLHNNTDGDFGISSYLKGYELETTADSLHINFSMDPDDLLFVTDPKLFSAFKKENVNVVLQSEKAPDDGSLSIYAMKNKIPYINVEVQHGHFDENLRLIEIAIKVLFRTYPEFSQKAAE
ncbi:hypothetical protein [Pedobacter heparinus]|uniref:hypothetical protein n=1 Tax=Pedobacter heparinus TaxID=984 RepID=UPI00292F960D|nr:hypothetical protein [Pedobacter heparinus]